MVKVSFVVSAIETAFVVNAMAASVLRAPTNVGITVLTVDDESRTRRFGNTGC